MKLYELTYLISPDLSEEEIKEFQKKIVSLIKEKGGILNEVGLIIKQTLAYPIKKFSQAYLTTLNFQLEAEKISDLEKKLRTENFILRYLIFSKKIQKRIVGRKPAIKGRKMVGLSLTKKPKKIDETREKKVELEDIEKKLEEILGKT